MPSLWQKPTFSALYYTDSEWYEARIVSKDLQERFFTVLAVYCARKKGVTAIKTFRVIFSAYTVNVILISICSFLGTTANSSTDIWLSSVSKREDLWTKLNLM